MLRALGFGQPESTDIKKEVFNPNDQRHLNFIDERLQQFSARRDALLSFDKKMVGVMGLDTFVWLSGFTGGWGPYLAVAGYMAIYFSAKGYGRDHMQHEFDQSLDETYAIYKWCANGRTPAVVTNEPRFQELLTAIIPFALDWRELLPWDLSRINRQDISERVLEIFEHSPHRLPLMLQKLSVTPARTSEVVVLRVPEPDKWVYQSRPYLFFAETAANAKLKWYGHRFDQEAEVAPQQRKG